MASEVLSQINVDQLSSAVSGLLASVSSESEPDTHADTSNSHSALNVSASNSAPTATLRVDHGCSAVSAGGIHPETDHTVSDVLHGGAMPLVVAMPSSQSAKDISPSKQLVPITPKKPATYTVESFPDSTVMFIRSAASAEVKPPSQLFAEQSQALKIIIDSSENGQQTLISKFNHQDDDVIYQVVLSEPQAEDSNDIVENLESELPDQIIMSAYCIECNRVWKSGCPQHIHTYTHVPDSPVYSRAITTLPSILQLQRSNDPTAPYIVMANVDIEARTVFGPLEGKRLTGVTDHHGDDPHHWQIYQSQGTQVIDCTDEAVSNWLMFLQRATRNSDQNIVAYQHGSDVYFVCRQKISAGETLQYWFSSDYAQLLGVGQSPEPTYSCSQCQREFDSIKLLNNHVARVHQESSSFKPHICGVCSKAFLTASKLKEHCVTHSGERPHQCPTCAKTFALPSNLKMHLRLHSNEKEFACKVCDKTFTQRAHLENHLLSHTKLKRHECQYCLMKFARPYDLRSHINCVHLKEKSYPCPECSSVFYKPQALKRHVARHVEKKRFKYKCSKCCMEFRGKGNLNRHFPKCNEVVELKQTEEKSWIIFK